MKFSGDCCRFGAPQHAVEAHRFVPRQAVAKPPGSRLIPDDVCFGSEHLIRRGRRCWMNGLEQRGKF